MLACPAFCEYTAGMTFRNTLFTLGAAVVVLPAAAAEWMTDLPAAQQLAAEQNKAVLVDFTGSDWCGWCVRLRKEVLDTPDFETYAAEHFVLMEVDVPQNPNFDRELRARNEELCNRFAISGFPTLLVLTPQGTVVGGFEGGRPNFEAVKQPLDAALTNAQQLTEAQALEGAEKAAALMAVYRAIPEPLQEKATDLRDEICALDTEDATGMKDLVAAAQQKKALMEELEQAHGDVPTLLATLERYLPEALPANRGAMLNLKAQLLLSVAESIEDVAAAKAVALEAADCDPDTAEQNKADIEHAFSNPESLLERARRYRAHRAK